MEKYKWYSNTHEVMSSLAMRSMPQFLQDLVYNPLLRGFFILGVVAPDRLFCDFSNHYYNCTPTKKGYHYGKVHEKVKKEIELINKMLDNTNEVILHPKASNFFRGVIDTPIKAIIFELGVVSHYVADAHQPFHTDGKLRYPDKKFNEIPSHRAFEQDVRKNLKDLMKSYLASSISRKKPRKITNFEKYMLVQSKKRNKYYDKLVDVYYPPNKYNKKTRFKKVLRLTKVCFNNSVYSIRSVWGSLNKIEEKLSESAKFEKVLNEMKNRLNRKLTYKVKLFKNKNIKAIIQKLR